MDRIEELMGRLLSPDNAAACGAAGELAAESARSDAAYAHMDTFLAMLSGRSSLVRNRAAALIAANARWDTGGRIDAALEDILAHITDEKPITARQFIKALPEIAAYKPALCARLQAALAAADFSAYAESMRPLLEADRCAALRKIAAQAQR